MCIFKYEAMNLKEKQAQKVIKKQRVPKEYKEERLSIKITLDDKQRIEKASKLLGINISSFVIEQALKTAYQVLKEHESIILSEEEGNKFLEIMNRPAQLNADLTKAGQVYKEMFNH